MASFRSRMEVASTILRNLRVQREARQLLEEQEFDANEEEEQMQEPPPRRPRRRIRPRRWYRRPWIEQRPDFGHFEKFLPHCRETDPESYKYFVRLDPDLFEEMLARIEHRIKKTHTNLKKPLEPGLKLAVTLRFLATGEAYKSLATAFRIGANSISIFVPEVCEAIIQEYMDEWLVCPKTPEEWKTVAEGFSTKWQFHHTLGAIDGKHIKIFCPPKSGTVYYNYKGYYSIVLMAIVDADGKFIYVDVGAPGSCSDGGIFRDTPLREHLEQGTAGLPEDEPLPGEERPCPYFFVGDAAFPLRKWLQKPHPERGMSEEQHMYNKRICRARIVVERVFGMLAQKFRMFLTTINARPQTVEKMVLAACILHNILTTRNPNLYRTFDEETQAFDGVQVERNNQRSRGPREVRDYLTTYYNRPENQRVRN